jgi:hypothetical protein
MVPDCWSESPLSPLRDEPGRFAGLSDENGWERLHSAANPDPRQLRVTVGLANGWGDVVY